MFYRRPTESLKSGVERRRGNSTYGAHTHRTRETSTTHFERNTGITSERLQTRDRIRNSFFIQGDMNARLQARLEDEAGCIGPIVFGRGQDEVDMNPAKNRHAMIEYLKTTGSCLPMTYRAKSTVQQITYRENTASFAKTRFHREELPYHTAPVTLPFQEDIQGTTAASA